MIQSSPVVSRIEDSKILDAWDTDWEWFPWVNSVFSNHTQLHFSLPMFFFFFHIEPHWIISKILYQAHSWRTHSLYGSPSPMGPCATALPYLSIFMLMLSSFNPITASALLLCLAHKRHWPYFFPLFCSFSFSALYLFPSFDPSVSLFFTGKSPESRSAAGAPGDVALFGSHWRGDGTTLAAGLPH